MTGSEFLDADQLSQVLAATRRDLFRMETLPSYDVPINGNDLQRWLAGEPEPTWENKQPWLNILARWAQAGRPRRRVRVIHNPPTDYERYACDWGYRLNEQAGENIRYSTAPKSWTRTTSSSTAGRPMLDGSTGRNSARSGQPTRGTTYPRRPTQHGPRGSVADGRPGGPNPLASWRSITISTSLRASVRARSTSGR